MAKKLGFVREATTGPSVAEQTAALLAFGIAEENIFLDREALVDRLQVGLEVVVSDPSRAGTSGVDVLKFLELLGSNGASLVRADTGATLAWSPDAQRLLAFAIEAESTNRRDIAANARDRKKAEGLPPGGKEPVEWTEAKLALLKEMDVAGDLTRDEMAKRLGVSRSTLQRKLREMTFNKGDE